MRTAVAGDHSASWRTPWEPRLHAPGEPLLAVDRAVPVNNFGTEVTLRPGSPTRPGRKARDTGRRGTGRNPRDQRPRGNHKRKGGGRSRHVVVLSMKVDVSARTGHTHRGRDNAQARPRGTPGAPLGTPSSAAVRSNAGQLALHGGLVNDRRCPLLPRADVRGEHALLGARSAIAIAGRRPPPVPVR